MPRGGGDPVAGFVCGLVRLAPDRHLEALRVPLSFFEKTVGSISVFGHLGIRRRGSVLFGSTISAYSTHETCVWSRTGYCCQSSLDEGAPGSYVKLEAFVATPSKLICASQSTDVQLSGRA